MDNPQNSNLGGPASQPSISADAGTLLANMRALDPMGQGVGLHQLRPFYPQVGWNIVNRLIRELEQAGQIQGAPVLNSRGTVSHMIYTRRGG